MQGWGRAQEVILKNVKGDKKEYLRKQGSDEQGIDEASRQISPQSALSW